MNAKYDKYAILRDQFKMSDYAIAKEINLSRSTLSEWKTGKIKEPDSVTLRKIADFFNVQIDYFYDEGEKFDINKVSSIIKSHLQEVFEQDMQTTIPYYKDSIFCDYIMRLWELPKDRQKVIFEQIEFQEEKHRKEKETDLQSLNKIG